LARRFPNQVRRVLIRDLTAEGIGAERYRKAFAGLSSGVAAVFSKASGIRGPIVPPPMR
jgi:phosphatidate phosphatase APP1